MTQYFFKVKYMTLQTPNQMKRKISNEQISDSIKKVKLFDTKVQIPPNTMKRKLLLTDEKPLKKMKTSDLNILKEMQKKLNQIDANIKAEIERKGQKELHRLDSIQENKDGFLKTFLFAYGTLFFSFWENFK